MSKGKYQNKEVYLNAALEIANEIGVEQLTMRKVAEHLDVSAMAIYKHFASKDELLTAALDELIARAQVIPTTPLPWDEWVTHVANKMYDALCSQNSWVPLLGSIGMGPNALMVTGAFLMKLTEAGFTQEEATQIYLTVIHLILGAVTIGSSLKRSGNPLAALPREQNSGDIALLGSLSSIRQIDISLPHLLASLQGKLEKKNF